MNSTSFNKLMWSLRDEDANFRIEWDKIRKATTYRTGGIVEVKISLDI